MKIFIGPTGVGMDLTGLEVYPPAQHGDIAAMALNGPCTIILIDGYFTQHLAPWHKEILFAIEKGCRVIGGGSLGALRAVECERYGMEKAGVICDWYSNGICTDDSEVALAHSSEDDGYKHLSIPLVNIRATAYSLKLEIDAEEFVAFFRSIFYMERSWQKIKSISAKMHNILKENYVNQKQLDAYSAIKIARIKNTPIKTSRNFLNFNMQMLLNNDIPINKYRKWQLASNVNEAVDFHLMAEMACALGIHPTNLEIDEQSEKMWKLQGIFNEGLAKTWMSKNNITDQQWNMFAIKQAVVQCARDWFNSTSNGISIVPISEEYTLFKANEANSSISKS